MLQPILHKLNSKTIVLASKSPRRQELIKKLGITVELCPSLFEENLNPQDFSSFEEYIEETGYQKVLAVATRLKKQSPDKDYLIIGADTMVALGDKLYGKPKTPEVAFQYLTELSGKTHICHTGVAIINGDKVIRFTETTSITFGKLTSEQIQAYIDTGEPLDKAGAYGIQGIGGTFVEKIDGDFFNVVGLPLYRLCLELCKMFDYEIK